MPVFSRSSPPRIGTSYTTTPPNSTARVGLKQSQAVCKLRNSSSNQYLPFELTEHYYYYDDSKQPENGCRKWQGHHSIPFQPRPLRRHPAGTRRAAQTVHAGHIRTTPGGKDHHGAPGPGAPRKAPSLRHRRLPGAADLRLGLPTVEPGKGPLQGRRRRRPRPGRDPEGRGLARGGEAPVGRGHPERLGTARDSDGLVPPAGAQGTLREPGGPLRDAEGAALELRGNAGRLRLEPGTAHPARRLSRHGAAYRRPREAGQLHQGRHGGTHRLTGHVFNVNYFCRLASIILAGSPPYPAPAAGPLRSGSWGR